MAREEETDHRIWVDRMIMGDEQPSTSFSLLLGGGGRGGWLGKDRDAARARTGGEIRRMGVDCIQ